MLLLDHVSIGVPDLDAARPFYDAIMEALGASKVYDCFDALGYGARCSADDAQSSYVAVIWTQVRSPPAAGTGALKPLREYRSTAFMVADLRPAADRVADRV